MQIWRIYRTLFWLVIWTYVVLGYYLDQCQSPYQWNLRAKAFCSVSPENYSCLYNVEQKSYSESCLGKVDYVKPGYRYVIKGRRANGNCSDSRYQPVKFWSNRSSECEFLKNKCNELGQVIDNNRSTTQDRACRCDYTKGFDFVFQPINTCYCVPSEEDCSCYQRTCSSGKELTQDYECISKVNVEVHDQKCHRIVETKKPFIGNSSTSITELQMLTRDQNMKIPLTMLIIIVTITVGIFIVYCVCIQMRKDNQLEQIHPINIITANKEFLIREMDTGVYVRSMLFKATNNKCYSKIDDNLSRMDTATIICNLLEKEPPKILKTFYKVLKKMGMGLVRNRLEAWDRIFRYKNEEILRNMIADNLKDIVECLIKEDAVVDIISCFKEKQLLQQKIDAVCEESLNDEISKIIELVMEDGLLSMLQLVYALFIVQQDQYITSLLLTQDDYNRYKKQ